MRKHYFIICLVLLSINLISAGLSTGVDGIIGIDLNIPTAINATQYNVNNSEYWGGYAFDINRWRLFANHTINGDLDVADDVHGLGTGSYFNTTLKIDGDIADDDATLVVLSDLNKNSCINLTEGANLGMQICNDGSGTNRLVFSEMEDGYEWFWIDRDAGTINFLNETEVHANLTAEYFIGDGSRLTNLNTTLLNISLNGTFLAIDGSNANQDVDINGNKLTMGEFNSTFANGFIRSYLYKNYFNLAGLNIPMLSGFFTTPYGDFNAFGIESSLWVVGNDYLGNPALYGKPVLSIGLFDNQTNEAFLLSFNGSNKNVDFFISDATAGGTFTFNKEIYMEGDLVCTNETCYNKTEADNTFLQNGTYINASVLEVGGVAITNWSEVNQSGSAGLWEDDGTYLQPLDTSSQSVNVSDINVEGEIQHENKTMIYMDDSGGIHYRAQI